jgi:hypothetical protein
VLNDGPEILDHKGRSPILLAGLLSNNAFPNLPERPFGDRGRRLVALFFVEGGDRGKAPLQRGEAQLIGPGAEIQTNRFQGGWQPLPLVFLAPVAKVLQVRSIRSDGVLGLALGGEVLQTAQAFLEFAETLWIFERLRVRGAVRAVVWVFPRIGPIFSDLREGRWSQFTGPGM